MRTVSPGRFAVAHAPRQMSGPVLRMRLSARASLCLALCILRREFESRRSRDPCSCHSPHTPVF